MSQLLLFAVLFSLTAPPCSYAQEEPDAEFVQDTSVSGTLRQTLRMLEVRFITAGDGTHRSSPWGAVFKEEEVATLKMLQEHFKDRHQASLEYLDATRSQLERLLGENQQNGSVREAGVEIMAAKDLTLRIREIEALEDDLNTLKKILSDGRWTRKSLAKTLLGTVVSIAPLVVGLMIDPYFIGGGHAIAIISSCVATAPLLRACDGLDWRGYLALRPLEIAVAKAEKRIEEFWTQISKFLPEESGRFARGEILIETIQAKTYKLTGQSIGRGAQRMLPAPEVDSEFSIPATASNCDEYLVPVLRRKAR